jgi:pyridoxamine 5'-phosphate oxidase
MNSELDNTDPIALFAEWYGEAAACGLKEPTAVTLATADAQGCPTARMVLLKSHDENGFVFYTNRESRKGDALAENPFAALCFYWPPLGRQVRVEGAVAPVTDAEADDYFASRDKQSQIGAWASAQSRPLESRFAFEKEIARYAAKYVVGSVPRPPHWSGYRIAPARIEFWSEGAFRLHDRRVFTRQGNGWSIQRLYP